MTSEAASDVRPAGVSLQGASFAYTATAGTRPFRLEVDELTLQPGEAAAVIGPSGSGKTTLVHLCAGILVPASGAVTVGGVRLDQLTDAERRRERARQVGLVFQEFELLDYLSALDNMLVPLRLRGANRGELRSGRARATELAGAVGIADLLGRLPSQLSQGERQRVAIARALVTDPALVLCDEPTGNLDPEAASHAVDLLLQQARARGAALLMVTHDHGLLDRFDRVIDVTTLAQDAGALDAGALDAGALGSGALGSGALDAEPQGTDR